MEDPLISIVAKKFEARWPKMSGLIDLYEGADDGSVVIAHVFGVKWHFIKYNCFSISTLCFPPIEYLEKNWHKVCYDTLRAAGDTTTCSLAIHCPKYAVIPAWWCDERTVKRVDALLQHDCDIMRVVLSILPQPIAEKIVKHI